MIIPLRRRELSLAIAACAAIGGMLAAVHYHRIGLTLSHYDARGHLAVARRIFDSITPGWQQIGGVWLPLPHLLNAIPVQIDAFYRTGLSAVALSVAAFALTTGSLAWIVGGATGSSWAAVTGAAAFALNPNVLYLQATPLTELQFLGFTMLSVALLVEWCRSQENRRPDPFTGQTAFSDARERGSNAPDVKITSTCVGIAFVLACMTRYEAWPVTATALAIAAWARARRGDSWPDSLRQVTRIAVLPAAAIVFFALFSRVVIGEWLIPKGLFVPDNEALGRPIVAAAEVAWGVRRLSGYGLTFVGVAGLFALAATASSERPRSYLMVPLSLVAAATVPWVAFVQGHPYRIRYMVALVAAEALGVGVAAALWKRATPIVAIGLIGLSLVELRPLEANAAMVMEAQWDRPNVTARQPIARCLARAYGGDTIMASMASLGHYMQQLSTTGLGIRNFLHEGNGDIWLAALTGPRPYAGWVLIEEQAEGGDLLARIAREDPRFLAGFERVCEGAGAALYRRTDRAREHRSSTDDQNDH